MRESFLGKEHKKDTPLRLFVKKFEPPGKKVLFFLTFHPKTLFIETHPVMEKRYAYH
jgi:hypothetical protein